MSTVTDIAELEAAIAENGLDADEAERLRAIIGEGAEISAALEAIRADRAAALETPIEQPAPPSEPTDKEWKSLARENDRHVEAVRRIMGGFVDGFVTCDACSGSALTPPGPPLPEPKSHDYFITCEVCNGFGQVLTGSHRAGHEQRDCPTCAGRGYLEQLADNGAPLAEANGTTPPPPPPIAELAGTGETAAPATPRFGYPAWYGDPGLGK